VVVAGPNGAGKSTYAKTIMVDRVAVIDPDRPASQPLNSFTVGRGVLAEVWRRFDARESFAVETTLSGKLPRKWIMAARSLAYDVTLYYIALSNPEIAIARVHLRVERGGHDVPERDIRRRFARSLIELRIVAPLVDRIVVIDNSRYPGYDVVLDRVGTEPRRTKRLPLYLADLVDDVS
jgi:predicted ABC-type ATPase